MTRIRLLALPVALVLAGLAAAPAHSTLRVRSDGAGLLVADKTGLNDNVSIFDLGGGDVEYFVKNDNVGDVFAYDSELGCSDFSIRTAKCVRNGPRMTITLFNGNDTVDLDSTTNAPVAVGSSLIDVGSGNDTANGHLGKDEIHGRTGEDTLRGRSGDDMIVGEENADRLEGGNGNDTLLGEGNADVLIGDKGDDVLRGGVGSDFHRSKEPDGTTAIDDGVDCGIGFDTVEADLKDSIQADCEEVDRAPVGETPNVAILGKALAVSGTGGVRVRLRCPRGVRSLGCNGRLQMRLGSGGGGAGQSRSRRVRYRIRAGGRKTVTLTLNSSDVRTLQRQKRRGVKSRGVLTSVERGRIGPKTTIRNPRLRLR